MTRHLCSSDSSPELLLLHHHSTSTASGVGLYLYLSPTSSNTMPQSPLLVALLVHY